MNKDFEIMLDGYTLSGSLEFADEELKGKTQTELEQYIYESICEYVKDNLEIIIRY